jgi:ferrous iron transport protein A
MPLTMAKPGETVTIRKITGKDEVRQHLAELGFVVDGSVTVVSEIAGNLILQVKESRIALDRTIGEPCDDLKEEPNENTEGRKGGRDRKGEKTVRRGPGKAAYHGHGNTPEALTCMCAR